VWGVTRDARGYAGPHPVVAHPPCERWGRYWGGGPSARVKRELGDDGGCFAHALESVRRCGGVLEHPEASHAWRAHGLHTPPRWGGWVVADDRGGWTCCVEQGHYGHRARKATWLYACGVELPALRWGSEPDSASKALVSWCGNRVSAGMEGRPRVGKRAASVTPPEFLSVLVAMARSAQREAA
jgi:hypothetical protein